MEEKNIQMTEQQRVILELKLRIAEEKLKKTESMGEVLAKRTNRDLIEISDLNMYLEKEYVKFLRKTLSSRVITVQSEQRSIQVYEEDDLPF